MRESPSPCASAAIMARGLVVPSAISPRIYRNLPSRPGKIGGLRKSPSPNVRAVERTTSRQDSHQPERRHGEVPSVGWPCPHSGRRRQLEDHALTIDASQPVGEHRERELPAILALQSRQRFTAAGLVLNDKPPALLPIPQGNAPPHITSGVAHTAPGTHPPRPSPAA